MRGTGWERRTAWGVPWVLAALLFVAFGPGLLRSALLQGDLPGHLEATRALLPVWPFPWTWDGRFLCGAPVGVLYPPLLHWLGATLAWGLGATWGLKVLLLVSVIALPLGLYRAARGLGLKPVWAGWASAGGLAVLWLPWRGLGGSLHQTLVAGNAANALGLVLLLPFVGSLRIGLARRGQWWRPSAWLALCLLTHFLVGAVASWSLGAFAIWRATRLRSPAVLGRGILAGLVAGFAASPFLIPFLAHVPEAAGGAISSSPFPHAFEWLALAALVLVVLIHPRWTGHPLLPILGSLVLLYLLRGVVFPLAGSPPFRMEYYRFRLYLYLALVPGAFLLLQSRRALRAWLRPIAAALTALLLGLLVFARYDSRGPEPVPAPAWRPDGTRTLVLASPARQNGSWHGLQLTLPGRLGFIGLKGLFVEASPLAGRVFELERLAAGPGAAPRWWGIRVASREQLLREPDEGVARRFRELGVDRVLAREPVSPALQRLALRTRPLGDGFTLYELPPAPLVRPADPGPDPVPFDTTAHGSSIRLDLGQGGSALVAVAAFSDWEVASGDASLSIAPPGVLRVEGRGPVALAVRPRREEWSGLVLGGAGWTGLALAAVAARRRRRKGRRHR